LEFGVDAGLHLRSLGVIELRTPWLEAVVFNQPHLSFVPLHVFIEEHVSGPFRGLFHDPRVVTDVACIGFLVGIESLLDRGIVPELQRLSLPLI